MSGGRGRGLVPGQRVRLLADSHVPRDVFDTAREHFDDEELAQVIWAITAVNAWNRVAVATRMLPGEYQPG